MTKTLFLIQAEGRVVPQEDGAPWPAEGMAAEPTRYVRRRLADGDLIEARKPKAGSTKTSHAGDPAPKPDNTDSKSKAGGK